MAREPYTASFGPGGEVPDLVFDKIAKVSTEDGGQTRIVELVSTSADEGVFVRVQSYNLHRYHVELDALIESGFTVIVKSKLTD